MRLANKTSVKKIAMAKKTSLIYTLLLYLIVNFVFKWNKVIYLGKKLSLGFLVENKWKFSFGIFQFVILFYKSKNEPATYNVVLFCILKFFRPIGKTMF